MKYYNPTPTVDAIVESDSKVLMIRRKVDPFKGKLALPGVFVNEGETVEDAMKQEAKEETSLKVEPVGILRVYSDPTRDPRKHVLTVVFIVTILNGSSKSGDDAADIQWIELQTSKGRTLHLTI